MKSRFIDSDIFTREKAESLKKLRIIKQNLIHVQGIPRSLTNVRTLKKKLFWTIWNNKRYYVIYKNK